MKLNLEPTLIAERVRMLMGAEAESSLAARLSVDETLVRHYLEGWVPDPTTLVRICEAYNVSPDWLLRGSSLRDAVDRRSTSKNSSASSAVSRVPPPVNVILNHASLASVRVFVSGALLVKIIRSEIQQWMGSDQPAEADGLEEITRRVVRRAEAFSLPRRGYINATGIIIHTGWGNAPFHSGTRTRLAAAMGASPTGAAESLPRVETCARLLRALTGAEAATVTTMNAASLLLVAGALASGRQIVVAARDLVEISHGARISAILQAGGAQILSVGSANCVYPEDYERALTPQTAMIMRIRVANMATTGYVAHAAGAALADLAHRHDLIYVDNLGGGSLVDLAEYELPECPTLQQGINENADLVLASGDKIIGGPQAGIIVGKKTCVEKLSNHPIARTCRPGKLTLSALEGTLAAYVAGRAWDEILTLRMLKTPAEELAQRAAAIGKAVSASGMEASVSPDRTECGGAVLPSVFLPTWTVRIKHPKLKEDELYAVLLARGVVARRGQGRVILDLRSVPYEDDSSLLQAIVPSLGCSSAD